MFDVGFFELIIILLVALIVMGPERCIEVSFTLGRWIRTVKQSFSTIQKNTKNEFILNKIQDELLNKPSQPPVKPPEQPQASEDHDSLK